MKIWIVIAAYNESKQIGKVLRSLQQNNYHNIVVVNDCSADNTEQEVLKNNAICLTHVINRGQGASLQTGIKYALTKGADIIVTFDADGQHHATDIPSLTAPIISKKYDVTLGSRFLNKNSNPPFIRKVFLKGGAFLMKIMYGMNLTDSHNGLRAINRKAAEQIEIRSDRMEHASEIVEQIGRLRLRYKEVPVTISYTEYSLAHGQSTWNAFRIFYKMMYRKFTQ